MMSRRTPPNQQGELQGINGSMSALAFLIAQLGYNNILATFTADGAPIYFPGAPFLVAAALTVVTLLSLLLVSKRDPDPGQN
jgi:MFS transporter, DHA1 family, tetracycline resistance protein